MGFIKKSAEKVNFTVVGQVVEGQIVSIEDTSFDEGVHNFTIRQSSDGKLVKILGTTQIDSLLKDELNSVVRLTYKGDVKVNRGIMKNIEVEVYQDETPAVKV